MDVNDITTLIGSLGFPICACVVMFKQNDKLQTTLKDISLAMQSITERITDIERKIDDK